MSFTKSNIHRHTHTHTHAHAQIQCKDAGCSVLPGRKEEGRKKSIQSEHQCTFYDPMVELILPVFFPASLALIFRFHWQLSASAVTWIAAKAITQYCTAIHFPSAYSALLHFSPSFFASTMAVLLLLFARSNPSDQMLHPPCPAVFPLPLFYCFCYYCTPLVPLVLLLLLVLSLTAVHPRLCKLRDSWTNRQGHTLNIRNRLTKAQFTKRVYLPFLFFLFTRLFFSFSSAFYLFVTTALQM